MFVYIIQIVSFVTFLYLWLYIPIQFLRDPSGFIKLKSSKLHHSYWLFYSIDMLYLLVVGITLLVAGFYAELKIFWLLLSIAIFAISFLNLSTIIMRINTHQKIDHKIEIEKLINQHINQIEKKRRVAIAKICTSIIWIYSWYNLFI